jgi:hypothetical protein
MSSAGKFPVENLEQNMVKPWPLNLYKKFFKNSEAIEGIISMK